MSFIAMKIKPEHLGFDIDGVVADTGSAFLKLAAQDYGINNFSLQDITAFDVAECLPISPDIIDAIFDKLMKNPIEADLQPMIGAVNVLTELSKKAPLSFITARPLQEPIAEWLKLVLGPQTFKNARLVAMGDHDGKPSFIKNLGLYYFIDDRAETCIELALHQEICPFVYTQPWNQGRHNLNTVDSWSTIQKICQ